MNSDTNKISSKINLTLTKKSTTMISSKSTSHNSLPNPSEEQLNIVSSISNNFNIIVDSVFGSGKTTTILHIASLLPHLNILCFTYSKYLKEETRHKLLSHNISNLEIHSFHSFAVKYYSEHAFNDIIFIKKNNCSPRISIPPYNLIIIDEIQDMTPDLFEFISHINHDLSHSSSKQFLLIGDQYQCIFKFKNADPRYLTFGHKIFPSSLPWINLKLSTSFRVTHQIAHFINSHLIGYHRVNTIKSGSPVNYIILNPFSHMHHIYNSITNYLSKGYKPDDIFIIAPSVNSSNSAFPLNTLENMLVTSKIPVVVQQNDHAQKMSHEEMLGKIAFCTFHAVKGLERKITFVFSFDSSYFQMYNKDDPPDICPSTLYVACSRSIEHLNVIHSYNSDYLDFIKPYLLHNNPNINFINYCKLQIKSPKIRDTKTAQVTNLIKFLPEKLLDQFIDNISYTTIVPAKNIIKTDTLIKINGLVENVSALYGTAIPFIKELKISNVPERIIDSLIFSLNEHNLITYSKKLEKIKKNILNGQYVYQELMFMTNCYMYVKSGYLFQLEQISNYDWVDVSAIEKGINRLSMYIDNNNLFEIPGMRKILNVNIVGVPDCIDHIGKILWEFKFVDEICKEHMLQLIIYAWIMNINLKDWKLLIFNIKTEEIIQITNIQNINQIITDLVTEKYFKQKSITNDNHFVSTSNTMHANPTRDHINECRAKGKIACI